MQIIQLSLVALLCVPYIVCIENQNNDPTTQDKIVNLNEAVVCDCGFEDENHNIWSSVWYADYSLYKSNLQYDPHYLVMDYTVDAKHNDTLERVFSPGNVKMNQNGGIVLSVKKGMNGKYSSAAIGTRRKDFLYGTYRARLKISDVPGTVAAFFFYRNDTSEIDIESLSRFKNPYKSYFAIQPQIYEHGVASPLTNEKHNLEFNPTQDYHEYRFDWVPGSVKFYIDGNLIREMTTNVPNSPGRVLLNHWTDGNPNFSGGPPPEDADLDVSQLNIFFNSSESTNSLSCQKSKSPCQISDIMSKNLLPGSEVTQSDAKLMRPYFSVSCLLIAILIHLLA
ncbi:concanavalin A-like lectin/glucanase domain-containing protein [Gilbertella persicaria]|uniref:concanavalin A-like lectin/glucanase domain-containing protein n=1 Tax=Gilbertella persicaria TaxID=101096 RepID=UPI0022200AEA|nr:concanavalin A-like lectin/glucanase domain-containing protein [Gilbertella persicaria]KAI8097941.1 concanavalin A-like lectin/glucanase domain-containing protein [Gilbertella persicaria]